MLRMQLMLALSSYCHINGLLLLTKSLKIEGHHLTPGVPEYLQQQHDETLH